MKTNQLPDDHHLSRYCKPSALGKDGLPLAAAFILRKDETCLSVNWLEYYGLESVEYCVEMVRRTFAAKGFNLRPNGRFVVITVDSAKEAIKAATGTLGRVDHCPLPNDQSHACLSGYSSGDLAAALELRNTVQLFDIYAAVAD